MAIPTIKSIPTALLVMNTLAGSSLPITALITRIEAQITKLETSPDNAMALSEKITEIKSSLEDLQSSFSPYTDPDKTAAKLKILINSITNTYTFCLQSIRENASTPQVAPVQPLTDEEASITTYIDDEQEEGLKAIMVNMPICCDLYIEATTAIERGDYGKELQSLLENSDERLLNQESMVKLIFFHFCHTRTKDAPYPEFVKLEGEIEKIEDLCLVLKNLKLTEFVELIKGKSPFVTAEIEGRDYNKELNRLIGKMKWKRTESVALMKLPNDIKAHKTKDLLAVFGKIAEQSTEAQQFLNELTEETADDMEHAEKIKKWMDSADNSTYLNSITELNLNDLELEFLPAWIGKLENLENLDISSNQLKHLPPEIGNLKNLEILTLSSNQLQELPPSIGNLNNLKHLAVSSNRLQYLPAEIRNLENLEGLYLSDNELQALPQEIGKLKNLENIELKSNQLQYLPQEIGKLKNLRNLDLSSNQLQRLPPEIEKLENLENLDLSSNQLQDLLPEIGNLKNLEDLNLSSNQLRDLPPEIGDLENLKRFDFDVNLLASINDGILNSINPTIRNIIQYKGKD